LFEALGIADQVLARAIPVPPLRMYKMPGGVEVLKEFLAAPNLEPTPSNPYVNILIFDIKVVRSDALRDFSHS
jgi:hypothetical protein